MDSLYSSLRSEIGIFEKHVQRCRESFDLVTLSRFLLALSGDVPESVESLQWVREQGSHRGKGFLSNVPVSNVDGYISWLYSYMDYLKTLKEIFDEKIVIPLCENLYVTEDTESLRVSSNSSSMSSQTNFHLQPVGSGDHPPGQPDVPTDSIPKVAKELFNVRRRWALLLINDTIKDKHFNPQSIADLHKVNCPQHLTKVLRLIPDIFYKSLLAAELSGQWVDLHKCRYGAVDRAAPVTTGAPHAIGRVCSVRQKEEPQHRRPNHGKLQEQLQVAWPSSGGPPDVFKGFRSMVRLDQEEFDFILSREGRVNFLKKQTQQSESRVHQLHSQLEQANRQIRTMQHRHDFEVKEKCEGEMVDSGYRTRLRQVKELQRQLALEKYRHSILQADWLLELEIRPALIRCPDVVNGESLMTAQQQCPELPHSYRGVPGWNH
ncbi:uncharacterized protein LOC127575853 [Pristis pectinata]|uniref:uncharacterized protein LOC127575853 n=1 Tax=Pristis pectinata TaxID=685728 RepID=UPI00223D6F5B|nr:uncharacterized protein LOC127575853 [Pristis pectinata]XP_051882017.1 uncharacterized protein LOC127575853 [Pristis pectinata]XP_051882025.1 uncharacterized protein LOC127575853 [Pristis pectinata]